MVGFCFLWIYSDYYSVREEADVFKYFDDALLIDDVRNKSTKDHLQLVLGIGNIEVLTSQYLLESRFWDRNPSLPYFNDNRFIIRFHAILLPFSLGNIYTHLLFANFISFLGLLYLFKVFKEFSDLTDKLLFLSLILLPSLLFWSSSILKENLLLLGFGGYLFSLVQLTKKRKFMIPLLLFALIIAQSKIYILFILLPLSISYLWSIGKDFNASFLRFFLVTIFFISLILNIGIYFPEFDVKEILAFKQSEFKCLAEWMGAGSQVYIPDLDSSTYSFIKALPLAIINALFRPFPTDELNALSFLSMIEIWGLYTLLILAWIFRRKDFKLNPAAFLLTTFFILLLSALIGWTTPVSGAIVRYRIVILPFIILAILSLVDFKKIGKFVPSKLIS